MAPIADAASIGARCGSHNVVDACGIEGDDGRIRSALVIAVLTCLLIAPVAHAEVRAVDLGDPQETPCAVAGACTPDISIVSVAYDLAGALIVSTTFFDPLPAYDPALATRVRINLGLGLTSDGQACAGDVRVEVGAYQGGASASSAAPGAVYVGSSQTSLAVTKMVSSDLKTVTVTASSPALADLKMRCTDANLVDDSANGSAAVVRDAVHGLWFPGWAPAGKTLEYSDVAGTTSATITALVDPGGEPPATAHVEFSTRIGVYAPQPESAPIATTQRVTFHLTGLKPGTQYHYRIVVTFGTGTAYTPDITFLTSGRPSGGGPTLLSAPAVHGAKKAGALLTCTPGRWKGAATFSYHWLRDGRRIANASSPRYRVRPTDRGHALRCSVTASAASPGKASASPATRIP